MRKLYDWLVNQEWARFLQIIIPWYLGCIGITIILLQGMIIRNGSEFLRSLGTDLIGGALLYVFLTLIIDLQLQREFIKQLILMMGHTDHAFAVAAARILKARGGRGFGDDKSLQEADLSEADLQGAPLDDVNLEGANLHRAKLQKAHLDRANLEGADLYGANLQEANLCGANLQGADLRRANLQGQT